jgi:hypothetical protein
VRLKLVEAPPLQSPLLRFRGNVTSQCGEDGIIQRLVQLTQPQARYCVEFGAWDGVKFSNCCHLLTRQGWRGLMIEANPDKYAELVATYRAVPSVVTANRFVSFEGRDSLDSILTEVGAPATFGVLSIDIDGNDFYVWESLVQYRPEIVVIEFNPSVPNDVEFVQTRSFDVNQGCSLRALIGLAATKGYELAVCTDWNAIFVTKEKFGLVGVQDNSIDRLYAPVQNGRIFQGYDGSIHVVGMDRLLWRNMAVSSANFQVLPPALQVFDDAQRLG